MRKKIHWRTLILSFLIVYLIAFLGSLVTSPSVNSPWYSTVKPEITPPNWIFPIVWNILFFLIALSLYLSWNNSDDENRKKIALVFGMNLFLNLFWSVLYFGLKSPMFAFYEIIILWLSIILMLKTTYKVNKTSAYLLMPYLLWVSFAVILNFMSAF